MIEEYAGEFKEGLKELEGLYDKNRKKESHRCPCYPYIMKLMEGQEKLVKDQQRMIKEQVNKCFHCII